MLYCLLFVNDTIAKSILSFFNYFIRMYSSNNNKTMLQSITDDRRRCQFQSRTRHVPMMINVVNHKMIVADPINSNAMCHDTLAICYAK